MTKLVFIHILEKNGYKRYTLTEDDIEAGEGWYVEHRKWMYRYDSETDTDVAFRLSPTETSWMSIKCGQASLEHPVSNLEIVNSFLRLFEVPEITGYSEDISIDERPYY